MICIYEILKPGHFTLENVIINVVIFNMKKSVGILRILSA
jgi:hypothetical protein